MQLPILLAAGFLLQGAVPPPARFDSSAVRPGPVRVQPSGDKVVVEWPDESSRLWRAEFSLARARNEPLITAISVDGKRVVERASPVYKVVTGKRRGGWDEFFDNPAMHPDGTRNFRADFVLSSAKARSVGDRVEIDFDGLRLGIFEGSIRYTFYPGSRLLHQEAIVTTREPDVASYYDAGLRMASSADRRSGGNMESKLVYYDTRGQLRTEAASGPEMVPVKARYRSIAAPVENGSVAVFPAPHQYFFPRDFTTNMGYLWHSSWRGNVSLGIRQLPDDNTSFYPWANAPCAPASSGRSRCVSARWCGATAPQHRRSSFHPLGVAEVRGQHEDRKFALVQCTLDCPDPVLSPYDRLRVEKARYSVALQPAIQFADKCLVLAAVAEKDPVRLRGHRTILLK